MARSEIEVGVRLNPDLAWVKNIETTTDKAQAEAMIRVGWKLLLVTGGLYHAIEYVLGLGELGEDV